MQARAARLSAHGKPLDVRDVDLADPEAGETVVDMAYAGVNPVDRYGALGRVAPDGPLPRTLGGEGAGTVGDRRVMVRGYGLGATRDGLWATQATVPERALIDVPDGVELAVAAAMGIAGVTAWRTVTDMARITAGDRVLVLGASGGVGSIVVSAVKAIGATVWGQTGSSDKAAWVGERGAERVVVGGAAEVVSVAKELCPTAVFDPLGGGFTGAAIEVLEPHGRLVIFGTSAAPSGEVPIQQLYRKGLTVHGYAGLLEGDEVMGRHIRDALEAARDGRLEVVVDRALPLDDVNDAFDLIESRGLRGKIVLDLSR